MTSEPAIIIGIENCGRCKAFKEHVSQLSYYQIPDKFYGLGDVIARITMILNIEKCAACKIRHYKFNKWFPFLWTNKKDRKIREQLIKLDATIFPVVLNMDMTEKYDLNIFYKNFTEEYPDPE